MTEAEGFSTRLRAAGLDDVGQLARMRSSSLVEMGFIRVDEDSRLYLPQFEAEIAMLLASGACLAVVAVDDANTLAGCAYGLITQRLPYPGHSTSGEVAGVYVAPGARHHGLAQDVVRRVISELQRRGVREIVLRPNEPEGRLYARIGFRHVPFMKFTP